MAKLSASLLIVLSMCVFIRNCVSFGNVTNVTTSDELLAALQSLKNSSVIKISPGNYTLNITVDMANLHNVSLQGAGKNFENVVIRCEEDVGISFYLSEDITFEKITFSSCGALRNSTSSYDTGNHSRILLFHVGILFVYSKNIFIVDTQIMNSPGIGITLYDVNGIVNFTSVVIKNNSAIPSITHNGTHIYARAGGGVYVEFTYSHAPPPFGHHGDAYHNSYNSDSNYTITYCNFTQNHAPWLQGKNDIDYDQDEDKNHVAFGRGGGFSVFITGNASRNTILIDNNYFNDNNASWGAGVFAELHDDADRNLFKLVSNHFKNNVADLGGGGARMGSLVPDRLNYTGNSMTISGCEFLTNFALIGGGLSIFGQEDNRKISKDAWVQIINCTFEENSATLGSALSFACSDSVFGSPYTVELNNCNISRNYAVAKNKGVGQGAIWIYAVQLAFKGGINFIENINTALLMEVRSSVIIYDKVVFMGNSGFKGGAAALFGDSFFQLMNDSHVVFQENNCSEKGGAIYVHWNGPPIVSLNTAEVATHGCFFRYSSDKNIGDVNPSNWNTRVEFRNNKALGKNASGDAIFADTLQGCLKDGENFTEVLQWDSFEYDSRERQIITNPVLMQFDKNHWSASPGESFNADLQLLDEKGNSVYSIVEVRIISEQSEVQLQTSSSYFLVNGVMEDLKLKGSQLSEYKVTLTTTGGQIVENTFSAKLGRCKEGFNFDNNDNICKCGKEAVLCEGNKVYIKHGYWAGFYNEKFVISPCPEDYCGECHENLTVLGWCLYEKDSMCKGNRSGVLCGSCKANYSALIGVADCGIDNSHSSLYALFILLFLFGMFVFVYLILLINLDIFTGYLNAWLFSYQIIYVLLKQGIQDEADIFIKFIIGVAHLELETGKGIYQFKGMNSLHKLFYHYLIPVSILIVLFIMVKLSQRWPHSRLFRRLHVTAPYRAFCTLFVLVYSTFTQTSLEILHFAVLDKSFVLFKDGNVEFFGKEHIPYAICALLVIVIIVIPVPLVLMFRRKFTVWCPCLTNPVIISVLDTFKCCFKDDQAWFAGFYFVARFFLLLWGTFLPSGELKDLILQISCLIVLIIFINYWPYRQDFNWINRVDFTLLLNLCLISQISGFVNLGQEIEQKILVKAAVVLLYVPLLYSIGIAVCWLCRKYCPDCCVTKTFEEPVSEFPNLLAQTALTTPLLEDNVHT